jgi:phosphatidylserine decarboxylase
MTIHKEGYASIVIATLVTALIVAVSLWFVYPFSAVLAWLMIAAIFVCWFIVLWFFRVPLRDYTVGLEKIVAPADGKVVTIEEITDTEYFKDRRIQVSIFMSPLNVHQNRNAVGGEVIYSQYHKGKYLVAWHPKSSTENERHSVVYRTNGREILVKQIAGALAKRIVNYLKPGMSVQQAAEMGFIKFGSRVDLLLPPDAKIEVKMGQMVQGGVTTIAEW